MLSCSLAVRPQKSWGKYYKSWGKHILMCLVFFCFFFLQSDTRRHNDFCFLTVRSHQMEKVTKKHYCSVLSCSQITLNGESHKETLLLCALLQSNHIKYSQITPNEESHKETFLLCAFLQSDHIKWGKSQRHITALCFLGVR